MTSPGAYDIVCFQGTDLEVDWTFEQSDGATQALYNVSAHLGIRKYTGDVSSPFVQWSTNTGELTVHERTGLVELRVDHDATALLTKSGMYDLFFQAGTGDAVKVLKGHFLLDPEVTR